MCDEATPRQVIGGRRSSDKAPSIPRAFEAAPAESKLFTFWSQNGGRSGSLDKEKFIRVDQELMGFPRGFSGRFGGAAFPHSKPASIPKPLGDTVLPGDRVLSGGSLTQIRRTDGGPKLTT